MIRQTRSHAEGRTEGQDIAGFLCSPIGWHGLKLISSTGVFRSSRRSRWYYFGHIIPRAQDIFERYPGAWDSVRLISIVVALFCIFLINDPAFDSMFWIYQHFQRQTCTGTKHVKHANKNWPEIMLTGGHVWIEAQKLNFNAVQVVRIQPASFWNVVLAWGYGLWWCVHFCTIQLNPTVESVPGVVGRSTTGFWQKHNNLRLRICTAHRWLRGGGSLLP